MRIIRSICWLVLLAGILLFHLDGAGAQGSDADRQACQGDAMRLCPEFIPDVAKITACMKKKSAQLSPPCRQVMAGGQSRHHRKAHHCKSNCG